MLTAAILRFRQTRKITQVHVISLIFLKSNKITTNIYCEICEMKPHLQEALYRYQGDIKEGRKKRNVLFNDTFNTFYLLLYGIKHMEKDHSDNEIGNPLLPHGIFFPISSKGSFICIIPRQDITYHSLCHTRLEKEIDINQGVPGSFDVHVKKIMEEKQLQLSLIQLCATVYYC